MFVTANIFQPLIDVFQSILLFFHNHVGFSWGFSIIALTILMRAILLPLTVKQFHSMQKMQRMQPQMKAIQARYKDDKQRQQQEIMNFYKEHKVNPFASCLPLLLQLPVFISLFYMLRTDLKKHICGAQMTAHGFITNSAIEKHTCGEVAPGSAKFLFLPDITAKATGVALVVLLVGLLSGKIARERVVPALTLLTIAAAIGTEIWRFPLADVTIIAGAWLFATFVFDADPFGLMRVSPSTLNIFIAVALASGPGIFRIVRGLTMDIKMREYVLAAQTRGESPWYIMLWEILPNARGPLIVDSCLRIGYTTILLGALGYFGLGMPPESPDWGTMIKESSQFMRIFVHPALPPALAIMSFVLGLNLLADSIREQSLRD